MKAFKLIEGSRVSELEKMIVVSVRYDGDEADYKDMCSSLKKTAGEVNTLGRSASDQRVTVEDVEAMAAEHVEVFAAAGFRKNNGKKGNGRRRSVSDSEDEKQSGGKGNLKCFNCRSTSHLCYTREGKWTCPEPRKDKKDDTNLRNYGKGEKKGKQRVEVKKKTLSLFAATVARSQTSVLFSWYLKKSWMRKWKKKCLKK